MVLSFEQMCIYFQSERKKQADQNTRQSIAEAVRSVLVIRQRLYSFDGKTKRLGNSYHCRLKKCHVERIPL